MSQNQATSDNSQNTQVDNEAKESSGEESHGSPQRQEVVNSNVAETKDNSNSSNQPTANKVDKKNTENKAEGQENKERTQLKTPFGLKAKRWDQNLSTIELKWDVGLPQSQQDIDPKQNARWMYVVQWRVKQPEQENKSVFQSKNVTHGTSCMLTQNDPNMEFEIRVQFKDEDDIYVSSAFSEFVTVAGKV